MTNLSSMDERSIYGKSLKLVAASNATVFLREDAGPAKAYTDLMSAYGACNFGHCNERIEPFRDYPADLAATFYPEEGYAYAEWLTAKLGLQSSHEVLYQVGGSAAVSAAISIAQHMRPGRVAYLHGSFHGLGLDALGITSTHREFALQRTGLLDALLPHTEELQLGSDLSGIDWNGISCFIFEPVQGANGYVPLDEAMIRAMIDAARQAGVIVIADEIQCGFYRHGTLSVATRQGYEPDMLLFSKSMTNGLYPFSAVLYPRQYANEIGRELFLAHTFQTSALGCYASMAVARYIDGNDLDGLAAGVENELRSFAGRLLANGWASRIHVTGPTLSFEPGCSSGKALVQQCLEDGLLLFTGGPGGERVRLAPPITIELAELRRSLAIIEQVMERMVPIAV